jgi:transposase-like protein
MIQGKILEHSTIHTDGWKAYNGLVLNGYDYYRYHSKDEFIRGKSRVNGTSVFGHFASADWLNLTVARLKIFQFSSKNANEINPF